MGQTTRQKQIIELIAQRGECSIEELTEKFGVSGMTIRRDLHAMADQGKVIRTHGGAAMAERVSFEFEFLNRLRDNQTAKEAIAATAATLINDGESVMLDSGTTTLELAKRLNNRKNLTIITSSLPIAAQLQYNGQIEVLLLGGRLRASSPDLAGAITESNLEQLRANVAFLGADAIDANGDVYQESPEVARMIARMAASATRVYVVADSSKLGKTALCRFGRLSDWTGLITDASADRSVMSSLKKGGIQVIKAE
jgi:DeoR family transcriptional regulator, fructose operon transcriptional repressor